MARLVIDASVARAAGGREHPTSKRCTDFLETVQLAEHSMVMTRAIFDEWQNHAAGYAETWRKRMVAKKRVVFLKADDIVHHELRDQLDRLEVTDAARRAMYKDLHLLEAALKTDKIVSSLNEVDRQRFAAACTEIKTIHEVMWVNPDKPEETYLDWLKDGAPADAHRTLGVHK